MVYQSIGYPDYFEASLLTSFQDVDGNGVPSVGDIVHFLASITNTLGCPITDIHVAGGEMANMTGSIPLLEPGATNNTDFSGSHVLTQENINNGNFFTWMGIAGTYGNNQQAYVKAYTDFSLDIQDGIRLVAFIDANDNGIQDADESNFNGGNFLYEVNSGEVVNLYANQGQAVIYETNPQNVYNLSYDVAYLPCSNEYTVGTPGYTNITVPNLSGITTYSFPIIINPCTDLGVTVSGQNPVPGGAFFNYVTIYNNGNQPIAAGTVTFSKDASMTMVSVSSPYALITPTGLPMIL